MLALILSLGLCFSTQVAVALADSLQQPQTCEVGIYVTALRNFNLAEKTFDAEFRLWSICDRVYTRYRHNHDRGKRVRTK